METLLQENVCISDGEEPIEYDENGRPVGITPEEWIDKLDRKLIEYYGENFRIKLNKSRAKRGLQPLSSLTNQ